MQGVFDFFPDLPARPKRPERLFFGLFPDPVTALDLWRFADRFVRDNHLMGARLRTERLHLSLHPVGDFGNLQTKIIYAATRSGNAVSLPPFDVTFQRIRSFEGAPPVDGRPRRRPLVLLGEGDGLFDLHKALGAAMARNGLRAGHRFVPHLTLLYGRELVPAQAVKPIRFVATAFSLIHSERGLTRYNCLERWSLVDARS